MKGFRSDVSADEFVSALAKRRITWRASGGSRRWVHRLTRSRIAWFKKRTGTTTLPSLATSAPIEEYWHEPPVGSLKIVLLPPSDSRSGVRKRLKRDLRRAEASPHSRIELLRQRRRGPSGSPLVGYRRQTRGGRLRRALFLDAIGAAIVPDLDASEVQRLEATGAIVLDNEMISVPDGFAKASGATTNAPNPWHLDHIRVDAARSRGLDGRGSLIGIVDTGIDMDHPEFFGKRVYYQSFRDNGELDRRPRVKDYGWHGTHVAGLCAGITHGVAPGADLAIAAVVTKRINGRMTGALSQILGGMNWLARGGAGLPRAVDIINASLGGKNAGSYYLGVSSYIQRGVLVVAAIGNNGTNGIGNHCAPGMFDCVLGIGAVDPADRMADFSDWGPSYKADGSAGDPKPDLCAPGVGVVSAIPGKGFLASDGTSMACPIVSGAAALVINLDEGLRRQPGAIMGKLRSLVRNLPVGSDIGRCGRGTLDLTGI